MKRSPGQQRWTSDCIADFIAVVVILTLGVIAFIGVVQP